VFFVPLGVSLPSLEHGRYKYILFSDGKEVPAWERDTKEGFPQIRAFAERRFEGYAAMMKE
jgi:hypothetical protein